MDALTRAIVNLIDSNPFYAHILLQMNRRPDNEMEKPAGISIRNGQIVMRYNAKMLASFSPEEVMGILEHESLHIVMAHLNRQKNRDAFVLLGEEVYALWNIAADMAINHMIDKPLPHTPILPEQFGLPKGKNAEFYYEALLEVRNNDSWELPLLQSSSVEKANSNHESQDSANAHIPVCSACDTLPDNVSTGAPLPMRPPELVDDHEEWDPSDDTGKDPELTQELIREVVERAANRTNKNHGRLPGCLEEDIESFLHKPQIPWMTILRRFVGTAGRAGTCYSWKRESRRFGEEQMGRKNVRKLRMVVAMDTSESISSTMLGRFVTEVNAIASSYRSDITVVQCDAEVQKVIRLGRQKMDTRFCGRGGTDFRPVFELIDREPISPNVLLYLTDLYGEFPYQAPRYPVIWIRTPESFIEEVPFGKIVFMPGGECQ